MPQTSGRVGTPELRYLGASLSTVLGQQLMDFDRWHRGGKEEMQGTFHIVIRGFRASGGRKGKCNRKMCDASSGNHRTGVHMHL